MAQAGGRAGRRRRVAARDLDRQGGHRGAEPRRGDPPADPRPGGRDGRRGDEARGDRARGRGSGGNRAGGRGSSCGRGSPRARDRSGSRRGRGSVELRGRDADGGDRRGGRAGSSGSDSRSSSCPDRRHGREDLRLAGGRQDRLGARGGREPGFGHGPWRPRDQEGHPRLRRVRRSGACSAGAGRGAGPCGRGSRRGSAGPSGRVGPGSRRRLRRNRCLRLQRHRPRRSPHQLRRPASPTPARASSR